MMQKLGKQKITLIKDGNKRTVTQDAFEDHTNLSGFTQITLKGRSIGAALLQKGKARYCFVFGFKTKGVHDTLRADQVAPTLTSLESGLKELPPGERLTLHLSSFTSDTDRQAELDALYDKTTSPEVRLLLMSEKARAQELGYGNDPDEKVSHLSETLA